MTVPDLVTTVKVPRSLRERIARDAAATGQTAAGFLSNVLDEWERNRRLAAVRRAYRDADDGYREETEAWNVTNADGTDG